MRSTLFSVLFSIWGVCFLGIIDSTPLFFFPLTVDAGVVVLTSLHRDLFWLYPIVVSATSLLGAAASYYVGERIGEAGIPKLVSKRRLDRVMKRARDKGAVAIAVLDLIPPPFPFTAFILTAGALKVSMVRFLAALLGVRVMRFGAEALLAHWYGERILAWMESDLFREIGYFLVVLFLVVSAITAVQLFRKIRSR